MVMMGPMEVEVMKWKAKAANISDYDMMIMYIVRMDDWLRG